MPDEWRRDYASRFAGIIAPSTYFDVMASSSIVNKGDDVNTVADKVATLLASRNNVRLPLTSADGQNIYGTQQSAIGLYLAQPKGDTRPVQEFSQAKPGFGTIESRVFGRFMPLITYDRAESKPEILSGIALQTFLAGGYSKVVYDRLIALYNNKINPSYPEWLRVALKMPPRPVGAPPAVSVPPPAPVSFAETSKKARQIASQPFVATSPVVEGMLAMQSSGLSASASAPTSPEPEVVYQTPREFFTKAYQLAPNRAAGVTMRSLLASNTYLAKKLSADEYLELLSVDGTMATPVETSVTPEPTVKDLRSEILELLAATKRGLNQLLASIPSIEAKLSASERQSLTAEWSARRNDPFNK
jgi:hypothetical protein